MEEPPHKRRKTSSPSQAPSSPLRNPPRRPSFASPTKASLARNYPNLLPTRTPPRDRIQVQEKQARAFAHGEDGITPEETEDVNEEPELPAIPTQGDPKGQEGPRRGILFSSPSKRPSRALSVVERSPLAKAPSNQQNQLTRPEDEASSIEGPHQARKVRKSPPDPEIERRKQTKAQLQGEIEELEAQVSRCTSEIVAEQQRGVDDVLLPTQRADLIKFVTKISGADAKDERPAPVSSLLCSFLPFSSLAIPPPKPKHSDKPIPSHQPLDVPDSLPYLEMFTSFKYSTQLGLPQGKVSPTSTFLHQKHTIDISGPQKLLTAQLAVNIDCASNEVIDMHVLRLPSWAERELGDFMRTKAKDKDLGNACWAVDSFWNIATKRANYWHRCEEAFARLVLRYSATDKKSAPAGSVKASTMSRKDLSRHLGRDVLILQDEHVLLKINWRITFDWTGEAESNVDVDCAVPAVWQEADASEAFRKIPETFSALLRTKGAFEATRIMVALLFPQ
ncbi:hypothetical protein EKO04_004753 [Ascochyta lentis]|uniref:Uncharacterized protein n=1 Tax=Ascochyta lentis TaxID=205686 RepID=A0A8H7MEC3_9PLEO|nr:hypothetical protein EKO04_004753 [Ascochyta lentis]